MKNLFSHVAESGYDSCGLIDGLEEVFARQHGELCRAVLGGDEVYQARVQRHTEAFSAVCEALGSEGRQLMHTLEDLQNSIVADEKDVVYLQGYVDCVALLKLMNLI